MDAWIKGEAPAFWGEELTPSGAHYVHYIDTQEVSFCKEKYDILMFLSKLRVLDYGTIYEQIDCIRIKIYG